MQRSTQVTYKLNPLKWSQKPSTWDRWILPVLQRLAVYLERMSVFGSYEFLCVGSVCLCLLACLIIYCLNWFAREFCNDIIRNMGKLIRLDRQTIRKWKEKRLCVLCAWCVLVWSIVVTTGWEGTGKLGHGWGCALHTGCRSSVSSV